MGLTTTRKGAGWWVDGWMARWLDGMYGVKEAAVAEMQDPLEVALVWTVGISSHYRREARKQVFDAKRDFRTMSCFPELGGLGLDSGLGRVLDAQRIGDDIPRLPNHPLIRAPFRRNMFVLRKREGVDPGPPCPVPCSLHARVTACYCFSRELPERRFVGLLTCVITGGAWLGPVGDRGYEARERVKSKLCRIESQGKEG
ncbi:hypothetical protein CSPX01_11322 [Colletotrichum filicis]|nr:hypothetical protein CSPX01_11322 [Colletotrichum filicis]